MKKGTLKEPSAYRMGPPNAEDVRLALDTEPLLTSLAKRHEPIKLRLCGSKKTEELTLPAPAVMILRNAMSAMAHGNTVQLIPSAPELTTQEAADLLNVSRPFLIQLLEEKKIPHHKVGSHRRVLAEDVLRYKMNIDRERKKTLDELAKEAQKLDMGY